MEIKRAAEIIELLADGKDPYTGETLPASNVFQQADTVRALHLALEGLSKLKRVKERKANEPPNSGQPWTPEEEQEVLRQFDAKMDVEDIAAKHHRTKGAIWSRLEKLGRVQPRDRTPTPSSSPTSPVPKPAIEEDETDYPF
ncbi:MAG: hypothetical protein PF795_05305 [Kiritimatiellae bacterium]|jgi:hypothetical protein|nr:hypothetical protein [Kiritimatiellia bacterium]